MEKPKKPRKPICPICRRWIEHYETSARIHVYHVEEHEVTQKRIQALRNLIET